MKTNLIFFSTLFLLLLISDGLSAQTTPLTANGRLKIINRQLCNEAGTAIQIRGMSSHGLHWFPQCYTASSLQTLATDWGADVFRAAMYIDEGGYTNDPIGLTNKMIQLVNWAEQDGMYCIIDWHILNPGDPNVHTAQAISFFKAMAQQFSGKKNVIYEICNEPNGVAWSSIKSYAEQVIPAIRQYDSEGIILVGTPNYSGTPWDALGSPLTGANAYNVMYTYHFYSGSHYLQNVRTNMENVLAQVPLFVSEWGTSNYSGNGGNDYSSAQTWMDFLAGGNNSGIKVSWANWNFADKDESSSALNPGACNGSAWNNTSTSGTWVKDHILHPADNFGPATPSVTITSPANNSNVTIGNNVTINANVSNATASTVQFYNGSNLLGSDNTAPYSWTINSITAGNYSFIAKAILSNATITSPVVAITATPAANQPPSVTLTAPATNTTFTAPASINITATANDADGSVAKVEFYNGNVKLGEDVTAPYEFSWTNVAAGTYTLTAKATDNQSAVGTSAAATVQVYTQGSSGTGIIGPDCVLPNDVKVFEVGASSLTNATSFSWWCTGSTQSITPFAGQPGKVTINFGPSFTGGQVCVGVNYSVDPWYRQFCKTVSVCSTTTPVNQPPVVSLSAPANNAHYTSPATVSLTANASDPDGSIAKVEFYNGSNKLGEAVTSPYNYNWANVMAGNYVITAKAIDNMGATAVSGNTNISVTTPAANQPPMVSITAPANNTSYTAPASFTITATASDADGSVAKVEFYNGSNKLGEATAAPYSYNWQNVVAGNYSLTAKATDNSNTTTTSGIINVAVNATTTPPVTSGISGPDCVVANDVKVYQLGAADRVNATNYSWWVNGSTQSITPGTNGTVIINFGPYFTGGQVWVGVNYSADPWYKQYSKNVALCSATRMASASVENNIAISNMNDVADRKASTTIYPTISSTGFTLVADKKVKGLVVMDGTGRKCYQSGSQLSGYRFIFGNQLPAGTYFVQVQYADNTRKVTTIVKTK